MNVSMFPFKMIFNTRNCLGYIETQSLPTFMHFLKEDNHILKG